LVRRGDVVSNDVGDHLRICLKVDELWPGGESLVHRRRARLVNTALCEGPPISTREREPENCKIFVNAFPERLVLLDLETCGLTGSALFLVGLLRCIDGTLAVELLLARDYSEERAVLASLWQRIDGDAVLVTFNGKCFDWPMALDRSRRHLLFRSCRPPEPVHVDLLHPARRRWRGQLPDCRLQTLERHICGRWRHDDIPGHQIPAAYHQYVRSGVEREMDAILLHNALDLVTLLDLAMRLAG
jgi:uncharacterized protein YprB with RNaseH-like and TPR domain